MEIDITGTMEPVIIGATGQKEIIQNVKTILSTIKGTVPLDRAFGINTQMLDKPLPVVQAFIASDIVAEVEKQEPRVKISKVDFINNSDTDAVDGILIPVITIIIDEDAV